MRNLSLAIWLLITGSLSAQTPKTLPNSAAWEFPTDIVAEQYKELRAFYEGRIGEAAAHRAAFWQGSDWPATVRENREHFKRMLGATETLREPKLERRLISESPSHSVWIIQWPILAVGNEGATSRGFVIEAGILILPTSGGPHPAMIVFPMRTVRLPILRVLPVSLRRRISPLDGWRPKATLFSRHSLWNAGPFANPGLKTGTGYSGSVIRWVST